MLELFEELFVDCDFDELCELDTDPPEFEVCDLCDSDFVPPLFDDDFFEEFDELCGFVTVALELEVLDFRDTDLVPELFEDLLLSLLLEFE